jgi:class 3 adenylate cyclase/ligand-binding sensor domain-containing protein
MTNYPFMMKFLVFALLGFISVNLYAQNYKVSNYSMENGLSTNYTKAVFQDKQGYVWIGSDEGVTRYNGKSFYNYKKNLPSKFVKSFFEQSNGQMYVITDMGIAEVKSYPDSVEFVPFLAGSSEKRADALHYPKSMYEDSKGNLWVSESSASVVRLVDGSINRYQFEDRHATNSFVRSFSFTEDGWGNLYVISQPGVMFSYNPGDDMFDQLTNIGSSINHVIMMDAGRLWIAGFDGIQEISIDKSGKVSGRKQITDLRNVSCIGKNNNGKYYAGTWYLGFYELFFEKDQWKVKKIPQVSSPAINDLSINSYGDLWISTDQGISLINPLFFQQPFAEKSYQLGMIASGGKVFSTDGINLYEFGTGNNYTVAGQKKVHHLNFNPSIYTFAAASDTIYLLDENGSFFSYYPPQNLRRRLGQSPIRLPRFFSDQKTNLWVSVILQNELYHINFKTGKISEFGKKHGVFSDIQVVYTDASGRVYCGGKGSEAYLFEFDFEKEILDNISLPLPLNDTEGFQINDIFKDANGILWLATSHGLLKYVNGSITLVSLNHIRNNPGINVINALAGMDGDGLWIGTPIGLVNYRDDNNFNFYDENSGLPNNYIYERGLIANNTLGVWVRTQGGIAFNTNFTKNYQTPSPIFTGIIVNNKDYYNENTCHVALHFESSINFEITTLSYPYERIIYQYRILGLQEEWSKPSSESDIYLPKIPSGNYQLEVRALQQQGSYSWSDPLVFPFQVKPAWYFTWWAIALFAIGLLMVIWITLKIYTIRLRNDKKRLEEIVSQRTTEIQTTLHNLNKEKENSEALLLNILPAETARELKSKGATEPKVYEQVTVLFTDFVGFTSITEKLTTKELVEELNYYFSVFEEITGKYNLEKIKTIGDSFMCAGGVPQPNTTNAIDAVRAALEIQEFMKIHVNHSRQYHKQVWNLRIGIHTGPVIASVIGKKKFAYDIWGDTVNVASRMETSSEVGKINISESTYQLVKDKFRCSYRGSIPVKNKGDINMYFVEEAIAVWGDMELQKISNL